MKKIISVMLAVFLMAGICAPAAYAADDTCDCGFSPVIYVAALGSATVYENYGTDEQNALFRPDVTALIGGAVEALAPAVPNLLAGDYDTFGYALTGFVNDAFGKLALDGNGNSQEGVRSENNSLTPEDAKHGSEYSFYFNYDFRLDPYEHADRLNDCIQQMKVMTGHDKVQLKASSMGGVVTMAYLERYGTQDVETIILQCCPISGTDVAGDLFNGKFMINKDALVNYALDAIPNMELDPIQGLLISLVYALDDLGIWEFVLSQIDVIIPELIDIVYEESLIPIFGSMPGLWSFVPHESYESAKKLMVNEETQAGLIEKIDAYHYNVQYRATEILREANKTVKIYIIAGYDVQRTPLVAAYMNTSDGTVDTKYASVGAVCADYGKTLAEDYIQQIDDGHNHLSADGKIDASTCALPESTWFINDMLHSTTHDGHGEMYEWMLTSDEQLTVYSNEKYPQFMQNNIPEQSFDTVSKLTPIEEFKANPSFTTLAKLLHHIFMMIKDFFLKFQ